MGPTPAARESISIVDVDHVVGLIILREYVGVVGPNFGPCDATATYVRCLDDIEEGSAVDDAEVKEFKVSALPERVEGTA